VCIGETPSLPCETVNIGCAHMGGAITAKISVAKVIDIDQYYIR